jgi:hypothetical protein
MNQSGNYAIFFFVQGIQLQILGIRDEATLERKELPANRIV